MSYTLAKWALWLIASAAIGFIVGWLLRGLSRPGVAEPSAEGAAQLALLRDRVANLEPQAADRRRLLLELEECRASAASTDPARCSLRVRLRPGSPSLSV